MRVGDFVGARQRRADWLAQVAGGLAVRQVKRELEAQRAALDLSNTELALISTATGLGHVLGVDDEDLALDGLLTRDAVVGLISSVWRGGSVPGRWSAGLLETYQSLFVVGRDTSTVRPDLLEALAGGQLHARLVGLLPDSDLAATQLSDVDDFITAAIEAHPDAAVPELHGSAVDWASTHLPLVAWLLNRLPGEARHMFTPLEVRAIDPSADASIAADIDQWCRMKFIPLSMPGSWPAKAGDEVPTWVREEVIEVGARFAHASTGNVPGWYFTSENDDEQRAFHAWTYNPGFFWRTSDSSMELGFVLRFAANDEALVWYRYPIDDYIRLCDLKATLAVGMIRVDHYNLDSDARLRHVQAFGTPLPQQLIAECWAALAEMTSDEEAQLHVALKETADVLDAMAIVDRNGLEGLEAFIQSQREGSDSEAAGSYRRMLELVDAATQDAVRGGRVDERLLAEARDELRVTLTRTERRSVPLDLTRLGPGRAYIQLRLHQESLFLHCFVAYLDGARPVTHQFEFSDTIDLRPIPDDIEGCVRALAYGLAELRTLLSAGIENVVLRTSPSLYGIPWHEALLRVGFSEVSYAHRLNSLAVSSPSLSAPPRALVRGYAGTGTAHLAAVSTELQSVATLYETDSFGSDTTLDVVHLSGHAVTGGTSYSVAIQDEPDRALSSARVVLDWRLSGTAVVVLSACSTGTVNVALDQVLEVLPLDVAFISAGAAAVVSTCAPVNDNVAAVFACAFHHELTFGGDVWNAYAKARQLARGDAPDDALAAWLDAQWPSWRERLEQALVSAPQDWQLLRLVGRCW